MPDTIANDYYLAPIIKTKYEESKNNE